MVIPWPIWDQKLQITWGLAAKKNMTIVDFRFSLFRHFGPFGGHWEKMVQLTIVTNIELFSFDMTSRPQKHYPDLPRSHPDTPRHTPDTTQTLAFCLIISNKTILRYYLLPNANAISINIYLSCQRNTVLGHHFCQAILEGRVVHCLPVCLPAQEDCQRLSNSVAVLSLCLPLRSTFLILNNGSTFCNSVEVSLA